MTAADIAIKLTREQHIILRDCTHGHTRELSRLPAPLIGLRDYKLALTDRAFAVAACGAFLHEDIYSVGN